ncbi:MAG: DUF370 domain-containing protein [Thermodesulfobacteriota bacterium]|nr:DUF370 domain-containing protein [Thermodesulfobacteriota bacterium]
MDYRMINIGYGNAVAASRVLVVINPKSSPAKKIRDEAKNQKRIIDVTEGRRTRSIIVLDSLHVILSSIQPETITQRFNQTALQSLEEE